MSSNWLGLNQVHVQKIAAYQGEGTKAVGEYDNEEFEGWLADPVLRSHLAAFANETCDSVDVDFILAERAYRDLEDEVAIRERATELHRQFFADDCKHQMNEILIGSNPVPKDLFAAEAAMALKRIQNNIFPSFKLEDDLYSEALRERERVQAGEIAQGKADLKLRLSTSESKAELDEKLSSMDVASRARIRAMMGC